MQNNKFNQFRANDWNCDCEQGVYMEAGQS